MRHLTAVQALKRIGGPDLEPFVQDKQGSGHALVIVGVPDSGEGKGTFVLGSSPDPSAGYETSVAEVEVNLKIGIEVMDFQEEEKEGRSSSSSRREREGREVAVVRVGGRGFAERFGERAVLWCGARVYARGLDVSHLVGTACVRDGQLVENVVDGADGIVGGGLAVEPVESLRTETVRNETGGEVSRWSVVPRAPNGTRRVRERVLMRSSCGNDGESWKRGTC
eukprot:47866-Hanusia_phi.AAC.1